jgi:histone-lysine N-methyltransferase SETD2
LLAIRIIDGETRIGIFATRGIKKGEHLTYDYQFVQFGADQDCHCGAVGCRRKLGVKPSKPKIASDEAFNLVAHELAQTLPKVHQNGLVNRHIDAGKSWNNLSQRDTCSRNCIGVVIRLSRPTSDRCFGLVRHFDEYSRKHSVLQLANTCSSPSNLAKSFSIKTSLLTSLNLVQVMFEDGVTEFVDMSREDWEIV